MIIRLVNYQPKKIKKKTKKTRQIKLNESVSKKIAELYLLMGAPDKDEFIFKTSRSERVTSQYINRVLKTLKERYDIPVNNFSTHTFRKTFGRYVYESNNRSAESLLLLNKIFKHDSILTTEVYIGITQDKINGVFESIQF